MQTKSLSSLETTLSARTGDCHLSRGAACRLISRGIGASVALALYVPSLALGGLLRYSYPDSAADPQLAEANPYLFADTGIAALLGSVREYGVANADLRLHAVGASAVQEPAQPAASGKANELALKKVLWREHLCLASEDLGGDFARSVWLEPAAGRLIVRSEKRRLTSPVQELRYAI
jgi:chemotaxis protein CheD